MPRPTGSCVAYARSLKELAEDLGVVRPSVLIAVPRIFEGVYAKVRQQLREKGPLARLLFGWTVAIGWRRAGFRRVAAASLGLKADEHGSLALPVAQAAAQE